MLNCKQALREEADWTLLAFFIHRPLGSEVDMGRKWYGKRENPVARELPVVFFARGRLYVVMSQTLRVAKFAIPDGIRMVKESRRRPFTNRASDDAAFQLRETGEDEHEL